MSRVEPLILRAGDRAQLLEWTRSSTIWAGSAQRARILVLAADGLSNAEISRRVGVSLPTVRSWRARYGLGGLDSLGDLPRSGRPPTVDETAVIAATLDSPPRRLGVTHWSARLLADHLGVSFATVARIWRRWGLQPWKAETFKFSTDPELEAKIRDVVGLYLDPPERAVVVCVDELGRAEARWRPYGRYVSSARPPNRTCVSPRIRLSTSPCRRVMRPDLPRVSRTWSFACSCRLSVAGVHFTGCLITQAGVESFRVVPGVDVPGDVADRVRTGRVDGAVDTLVLQGREEGLGHRVIVTDPGPPGRMAQAEVDQSGVKLRGGVVAPPGRCERWLGRPVRSLRRLGSRW